MASKDEQHLCNHLIDYVMDQLNEIDRLRYERHLHSCPSCVREVSELREVWESMPYTTDMIDPPLDLKERVMNGIFTEPQVAFKPFSVQQRSRRSYWFYSICTAVILSIMIGTLWNYQITEKRQLIAQSDKEQMEQPSVIENLFPLSAQVDPNSTNPDDAYGIACVVRRGDHSELVVYVYNAANNQGEQAYQVWLVKDTERMNAGTFQVGDDGIGVLTYPMKEQASFDAIGITLEPDSKGNTPRGEKIFGNSEQISWY